MTTAEFLEKWLPEDPRIEQAKRDLEEMMEQEKIKQWLEHDPRECQ